MRRESPGIVNRLRYCPLHPMHRSRHTNHNRKNHGNARTRQSFNYKKQQKSCRCTAVTEAGMAVDSPPPDPVTNLALPLRSLRQHLIIILSSRMQLLLRRIILRRLSEKVLSEPVRQCRHLRRSQPQPSVIC